MSKGKTRARELRMLNSMTKKGKKRRIANIKYRGRWMTSDEYAQCTMEDGDVAIRDTYLSPKKKKQPLRLKNFDKEAMGGRTFRWIAEDQEWEEILDYNYPAKPKKKEPKAKLCREEMANSEEERRVDPPFYNPGVKTTPYLEWASEKVEKAIEVLAKKWCISIEEVKIVPSKTDDQVQ